MEMFLCVSNMLSSVCRCTSKISENHFWLYFIHISKGFTFYFTVAYLASFRVYFFFLVWLHFSQNQIMFQLDLFPFLWQNKWEKHKLRAIELLVETVKCIASQREIQMPRILIFFCCVISFFVVTESGRVIAPRNDGRNREKAKKKVNHWMQKATVTEVESKTSYSSLSSAF